MEEVARIIAGCRPRRFNIDCSLENLLLLEHLVQDLSEHLISRELERYGVKMLICADYSGCTDDDFEGDLLYSCCRRISGHDSTAKSANPGPKDYMAAGAYMQSLDNRFSLNLVERARNMHDLKAIMLIDELYPEVGEPARALPIAEMAINLAGLYPAADLQIVEEPRPVRGRHGSKWIKKAVMAAALLGIGTFGAIKGVSCYNDWKVDDEAEYDANMGKLSECKSYFGKGKYRDTVECNRELKLRLSDLGWFASSKSLTEESDGLDENVEKTLTDNYNNLFSKVKGAFDNGKYTLAAKLNSDLISKLEEADYFSKGREMLDEASLFNGRINEAIEEARGGSWTDKFGKVYAEAKSLPKKAYLGLKGFYESLGMGQDTAEVMAIATFFMPVLMLLRRILRRRIN